ncbi:hypothetical protein CVT24_010168 [Panaeolus cyanescens]|uniref:G domain-containing protein n=1 Tax=Panaeolus cyanescens TaxID=181874 RepID=A0A409YW18_9AGAR|nr:hypothetical protein CVT24_010168 [Panaeolus cyanescens]
MRFKNVQTGDISIERWSGKLPQQSFRILLLGVTGSGKSSFIEALAGSGQQLGISGGTLESVTQDIEAFRINNLLGKWGDGDEWPIYLVDSPGFSDSKLSELEIVNKIEEWRKINRAIHYVFYFCRITDTRMPGTVRRLMKLVKSLDVNPSNLTVITSMWNTICRAEAMKRAEDNFAHLRNVTWKDEIKEGANIVKFQKTQPSAVAIVSGIKWAFISTGTFNVSNNPLLPPLVFAELLDRIQNAQLERQTLLDDRIQLLVNPNDDLESIFVASLRDVDERIVSYINQLIAFGAPPAGFDINPRSVQYQNLLHATSACQRFINAAKGALKNLPSSSDYSTRRGELKATIQSAKQELEQAYFALRDFGSPPAGLGSSSIPLHVTNQITLEALYQRHRLQLRLKRQ